MSNVTALDVERCARGYLGVPWAHQGRSRAGLDCVGLVIRVGHDLGLSEFDLRDYSRFPSHDRLRAVIREHCGEVDLAGGPAPGQLALISFRTEPSHLAITGTHPLGGCSLIHALSSHRGAVVEHRIDRHWKSRFVGLFELPGVAYG